MGFSVSASAVIIFVGLFIAFGAFFTASSNSFERVSDARESQIERGLSEDNTAIEIKAAEYDGTHVTVLVNNTGTTAIALNRTDILLDNEYVLDWESSATVNGNSETNVWLPGEQLNITIATDSPSRVKVVTESGVADTETEVL